MDRERINQELVDEFIKGSETAFGEIYERLGPTILRLGRQMFHSDEMAKDFVQDVFLRAWLKRDRFVGVESFNDYLYKLARNLALKCIKKNARNYLSIEESLLDNSSLQTATADQKIRIEELEQVITTAISKSSPRQQLIFSMSREEGLSQKEIAQKLGLAKQTVNNEITSMLRTIRGHLKTHLISPVLMLSIYLLR